MPFGLGDYVESALKPHVIYFRRQGISLAVAAVFGAVTLLFVVLSVFLALTYLMAPLWAAMLCAVACAAVAGTMLKIVQRRARVRAVASAEVVAAKEGHEPELQAARLKAAASFASSVVPALLIGAVAFFLGRKRR